MAGIGTPNQSSSTTIGAVTAKIQDSAGNSLTSTTNALDVNIKNAAIPVTGTFWQATQPVSGSVTANAGTNLNTSALAIESGGNLATIAGAVTASKMNVNISSGSIANTSFAVTQGTASNLKTEAHLYDSSTNGIGSTSNALDINIKSGSIANTAFGISSGSNTIGKISDITTSVVPGTAATNLGKAVNAVPGSTDTGVAILGILSDTDVSAQTSVTDGNYSRLSISRFKELRTRDQRAIDLANCNSATDYTVLGNDTANLANSTNHVFGTGAITFDKVNGAANTVYAGVSKTMTAMDVSEIFEAGGFVGVGVYLPSLTNVVNVFLRVGTDASNYNCWTWPVAGLTASTWLNLRTAAASPDYARNLGTGWNTAAIAYVAFGVEFSGETNTLAGIVFDHVHIVGGRVTASDINASISSSVNTPNVNINRVGGTSTDTNNGAATAGTLRVTVASDSTGQIKLAAGTNEVGFVKAASGNIASGAIASGAVASGAVASGAIASGAIVDGANVTFGAKADARSTATDTTAITAMQVLKEISYMEQNPASRAVTGTFWQTTQPVSVASAQISSGAVASGAIASGAVASGAVASGAFASGALSAGSIAVGAIAAGDTSIATTEDTARAGGEHLVKVGISRLDTPVANANVSNDGDYTNITADNFGKVWVSGTVPEDTAHVAGEALTVQGSRRILTLATSSGSDADWSTVNQTAEGAAWATLAPTTTSGLSVGNFTSGDSFTALTNSAQVIKASAGLFYGYYIYNPNTSATYVEVYNVAAASVTVGTTNPLLVFCIPASSAANLALPYGLTFDTAMSIAATTTGGGNTAPTTALEAMVWFK